ncbi:unnamed protein product, partial [Porites evermanni]
GGVRGYVPRFCRQSCARSFPVAGYRPISSHISCKAQEIKRVCLELGGLSKAQKIRGKGVTRLRASSPSWEYREK